MKNAAKCDKQCELQNSVNHRIFERTLRPLVFRWACLFECLEIIKPVRFHRRAGLDLGACRFAAAPLKCIGFGSLREYPLGRCITLAVWDLLATSASPKGLEGTSPCRRVAVNVNLKSDLKSGRTTR